jgi:hypothetical protein
MTMEYPPGYQVLPAIQPPAGYERDKVNIYVPPLNVSPTQSQQSVTAVKPKRKKKSNSEPQ